MKCVSIRIICFLHDRSTPSYCCAGSSPYQQSKPCACTQQCTTAPCQDCDLACHVHARQVISRVRLRVPCCLCLCHYCAEAGPFHEAVEYVAQGAAEYTLHLGWGLEQGLGVNDRSSSIYLQAQPRVATPKTHLRLYRTFMCMCRKYEASSVGFHLQNLVPCLPQVLQGGDDGQTGTHGSLQARTPGRGTARQRKGSGLCQKAGRCRGSADVVVAAECDPGLRGLSTKYNRH